jgi:hypothetical protein
MVRTGVPVRPGSMSPPSRDGLSTTEDSSVLRAGHLGGEHPVPEYRDHFPPQTACHLKFSTSFVTTLINIKLISLITDIG